MNERPAEPTGPEAPKGPALPNAGSSDKAGLVTLVKCATLVEADAIRAQLEAADIKSFLPDEALMQNIAWNVNTYGYIRVQVYSEDRDAAEQLLSSIREAGDEADNEPGAKLAELPLSPFMKGLGFAMPLLTFPGLLMFLVARSGYLRQGCNRKARELGHWFVGGIAFWVIAFIVLICVLQSVK